MTNLEKQFGDLKDQLYKDRLSQVDAKLQEVIAGKASEYLDLWQICRRTCRSEQRLRAVATFGPHRGKTNVSTNKNEKQQHNARSEEGKLFYDGEWYCRGQTICIDKK
ncbi:unnamed protein product, partial [Coregonus sp. 'balchen']